MSDKKPSKFLGRFKKTKDDADPVSMRSSPYCSSPSIRVGASRVTTARGAHFGRPSVLGDVRPEGERRGTHLGFGPPHIRGHAGPADEQPIIHAITHVILIIHFIFHQDPSQAYERPHRGLLESITRSRGERFRDGAIMINEFVSIIADASDVTKPLKVACDGLNYILKNARVNAPLVGSGIC
jgi:hypothetical protein